MTRGRKPKPTKIKQMEGNPGHRHLPVDEPEPTAMTELDLRPPDHLDRIGRNLWKRTIRAMPAGVITKADRAVLELYCDAYAQWRHVRKLLSDITAARVRDGYDGILRSGGVELTPNGLFQTSPLVTQMRQWSAMTVKLAAELGLTPAARPRLGIDPAEKEDALERWLKEKQAQGAARVVDMGGK